MSKSRKPPKLDVQELLGRLGAQEDQFLRQEFLAPVIRGGEVRVGIAGAVCKIRIRPRDFQGWGVFQPVSHTAANLSRPATLAERRQYLELFPQVRLIVCMLAPGECLCSPASFGDLRIQIDGLAPVELAEAVQLFDVVDARYDGTRFWFEGPDPRHNPATAVYLRAALAERRPPVELDRPGLTAEERAAYEVNYWQLVQPAADEPEAPALNPAHRRRSRAARRGIPTETAVEDPIRRRLRATLSHAGAQLVDYLERADSFRVTYSINGRRHTSAVNKADLTVQVAGICLSGEDRKFDLASLIGVLREADDQGRVVPVGQHGLREEDYWRVHPPRNG